MNEHDSERMLEPLRQRIAELEAELIRRGGEIEAFRAARARDAAALAERDQERAELEALRDDVEDLEDQLKVQRTRGNELASLLATERSWGDELERLLAAARARVDKLERELHDERHFVHADEAGEPDEAHDVGVSDDVGLSDDRRPPDEPDGVELPATPPPLLLDREPVAESTAPVSGPPAPEPLEPVSADHVTEPTPPAAGGGPRWTHRAQLNLAAAQASCSSWGSVLTETVRIVGSEGGWDAVLAWVLDKRDTRYTCRAAWCRNPDEMARFETSMWQVRQVAVGSPIGDVASAVEPKWVRGTDPAGDPHLSAVAQAGLTTIALLPVRHGVETIAVLELCVAADLTPDADLDIALQAIAAGLAGVHQLLTVEQASRWTGGRRRI